MCMYNSVKKLLSFLLHVSPSGFTLCEFSPQCPLLIITHFYHFKVTRYRQAKSVLLPANYPLTSVRVCAFQIA